MRVQLGGEVSVAREGEQFQPIGRVAAMEWQRGGPMTVDVEQSRPIVGWDPASPQQPYFSVMIRGLAYDVARRRYRPGKLDETHEDFMTLQAQRRYPKRVDLARERRRLAELNRRDRRRRRTGRPPIGLQGPVEVRTRYRRVQIMPPLVEGHLQLIADQMAGVTVRMNAAVRELGRSFAAMSQAFAAANAFTRSALEEVATRSMPHRYATGGVVYERRDPDDDRVPVRISPGEVRVTPEMARRYGPILRAINGGETILRPIGPDLTHYDRWLGEGALDCDETSSVHSTDSSGTGAVWSDLMARIDGLVDGKE